MFVQRRDGAIVGVSRYAVSGIIDEQLADSDPQIAAFFLSLPNSRQIKDALDEWDCRLDANIMALIDQGRPEWRNWAANNFQTLTAAEKIRLGDLFWVVSVSVRRFRT